MQIKEIIEKSSKKLELAKISEPVMEAKILFAFFSGLSKEKIFLDYDKKYTEDLTKFWLLIQRRESREPISHIIGLREFYGREFTVNSDVLDPRPDTETIIDFFKQNYRADYQFNFCEIGTGSGCISITLLLEFSNANSLSIDISEAALEKAKINRDNYALESRMKLVQSDLFNKLPNNNKFDFIISNPPYIPSKDIEKLEPEVRLFEPRLALDGGLSGLDFYQKIAKFSADYLKENGEIILEIGKGQEDDISKIFKKNSYKLKQQQKDLNDIIRILVFKK